MSPTVKGSETTARCRRLIFTGPKAVDLVEVALPDLGPRQVVARTVVSGISHGTEMAWLTGNAVALHRAWDGDRRLFLDAPGRGYPIAPGYETVAMVTAVGSHVTSVGPGDLVYVDRPHAEAHVVDAAQAVAGVLPKGTTPERAVFWALARVALGGVHDAALSLGETVVITGLGTVGLLAAQLARMAGAARVIGVDHYRLRLDAAAALGVDVVPVGDHADLGVEIRRLVGAAGADVAIEASGSYAGLHEAIRACRVGGRVATIASYHGDQPGLSLGEEYHRNRITLISSMTVCDCPQRRHPAWTLDRLNLVARELITTGRLRVDGFITHRVPFTEAERAYRLIDQTPQDTIKVVLTYDQ